MPKPSGAEDLLIFRIQNEIRGLRLKTKTLDEVSITSRLKRLAITNPHMAEELENDFTQVVQISCLDSKEKSENNSY